MDKKENGGPETARRLFAKEEAHRHLNADDEWPNKMGSGECPLNRVPTVKVHDDVHKICFDGMRGVNPATGG